MRNVPISFAAMVWFCSRAEGRAMCRDHADSIPKDEKEWKASGGRAKERRGVPGSDGDDVRSREGVAGASGRASNQIMIDPRGNEGRLEGGAGTSKHACIIQSPVQGTSPRWNQQTPATPNTRLLRPLNPVLMTLMPSVPGNASGWETCRINTLTPVVV